MAAYDMEAVRSFLDRKERRRRTESQQAVHRRRGNGRQRGVNWALQDWAAPPLAIGKQGQDVKALVLISPQWSYNGLSFQVPMKFRPLKQNVAWLLMYGAQDAKVKADVERIEKQLERFHPEPAQAPASRRSALQVVAWPSKLQGGTLLTQAGAPMEQKIIEFLVEHVGKCTHTVDAAGSTACRSSPPSRAAMHSDARGICGSEDPVGPSRLVTRSAQSPHWRK